MDRYGLAAGAAGALLEGMLGTTRYETRGAENYRRLLDAGEPVIYVLWHGRLLPLAYQRRGEGIVALVSRSRDGEYLARLLSRWGFSTERGSSSRGGTEALRGLLRSARAGRSLCITPDGPRGPRERVKLGALAAAQATGLPIIPCAAGASRAWWIEGWDRFLVPKPFARIRAAYGAPIRIARGADRQELARLAAEVEGEIGKLMAWVDGRARA